MLPPKNRLASDRDIKRVNAKARPSYSRFLRLKALPNGLPLSRAAVVVSTRVSKKATARNRIKRQLREIIRHDLPKLKPGFDILISVSTAAIGREYAELVGEISILWTKARLLK